MTKPVVVIGSNSFSAAYFCKYLLSRGETVVAISRSPEPHPAFLPYRWLSSPSIRFYQYDINQHLSQLDNLLDSVKPCAIYNFAAQSMVAQSWDNPEHWFNTNVVSTVKLHDILRHKDYLDTYIHVSTPEVYGSCSGFIDEKHPYAPSTPYAVSRAAADMSLQTFSDVYGFPVVVTRAANVYGPAQQLYRIIPKTILSIIKGIKLPLHGGGHSERVFIHMQDVSAATYLIAQKGIHGETYHISGEDAITIRELVSLICNKLGKCIYDVCEITEDRPGKDAAYKLNAHKLKSLGPWAESISLSEGIDQTIEWVQQNLDVLENMPMHYIHKP